ncbi:hypothetical protein NHQ30_005605 [Ciborinia camelliae]|nr:hypothetical protein NHQ30_005605 [Ciborinia camelliae]
MMVPNPSAEALAVTEQEQIQQLAQLHAQLADLDLNRLRASHDRRKVDNFAAKKQVWFDGINQKLEGIHRILSDGEIQTLLGSMKVSHDGILVTLGTQNDSQSIENAWEESMRDQIESLTAQGAEISSTQCEQRKEILKNIHLILGYSEDEIPAVVSQASVNDARSTNIASDRIASLELELSNTKEALAQAQSENESLILEHSSTRDQLQNIRTSRESTNLELVDANKTVQDLKAKLAYKIGKNNESRRVSAAISLRFFNLSTRRNNHGAFTLVSGRGIADLGAIHLGSDAAHGGNVRLHASLIHTNFEGKFGMYPDAFKLHYDLTVDEVIGGWHDKFRSGSKNTEIANMRATMVHCLSFSELTHDKDGDALFDKLRGECRIIYASLLRQFGSAAQVQRAFDESRDIARKMADMRIIAGRIVDRERQRLKGE